MSVSMFESIDKLKGAQPPSVTNVMVKLFESIDKLKGAQPLPLESVSMM